MRFLILNWRDIENPRRGGAEVVTFEVVRRWVAWGHQVTWLAAGFPGGAPEEEIHGVHVIRRGRQPSVHFEAFRHYRRLGPGRFDVVIDEINTIPFFTPLYVREAKVAFIHQLAREVWQYESAFPIKNLGYLLEPRYLGLYRHTPTVTVSESTRQDLLSLGFRQIYVVHDGLDVAPLAEVPSDRIKAEKPTLVYVGRVVPSKRVGDLIQALSLLQAQVPGARLWIAGDGKPDYIASLKRQAERLAVAQDVRFWGRVPAAEKWDLLKSAHAMVLASVREGWGLVVIEANAMGTPAVVYSVPGLVDSVQHGRTGLVCESNTPQGLADQASRLLLNRELRENLAENALVWSRQFSWERNAREFLSAVSEVVDVTG